METLLIGATFLGSVMGAFVLQKVALEGLFRLLQSERRVRH